MEDRDGVSGAGFLTFPGNKDTVFLQDRGEAGLSAAPLISSGLSNVSVLSVYRLHLLSSPYGSWGLGTRAASLVCTVRPSLFLSMTREPCVLCQSL